MMPAERLSERVTLVKHDNPLAESPQVEVPRLHITVERQAGERVDIKHVHDGDVCRIGAHPSNDLVLADKTISRFHCRILRAAHGWRIVDTGSRNGTRVDGVRVLAAELEDEVSILLGESVLRVRPAEKGDGVTIRRLPSFGALLGRSVAMQQLYAVVQRVATSDIDVLLTGESGTGKELVANELRKASTRADAPFVVVDCGSISPALVESELFGHVRGAFTGADRERMGAFETADGGTVFLDEIGELPLEMQPKLLRALEAREVRRVGETKTRKIDVRVIAATHRDLEREVNQGRFREDLYYRLAKVNVRVPPLRDRPEDIPILIKAFLSALGQKERSRLFSPQIIAELRRYDWPGNVRELKNYVERSVVLDTIPPPAKRSGLQPAFRGGNLPPPVTIEEGDDAEAAPPTAAILVPTSPSTSMPTPDVAFRIAKESVVEAFERSYIGSLLERCNGNVSKAARVARMDRTYLHQLAQKYGFRSSKSE
jgi:DNA-binding NtrC family response regulator